MFPGDTCALVIRLVAMRSTAETAGAGDAEDGGVGFLADDGRRLIGKCGMSDKRTTRGVEAARIGELYEEYSRHSFNCHSEDEAYQR